MSDQFPVALFNVIDRSNRLFGNDQKMYRRLGINVFEGEADIVFVDDISRYFTVDDFGEQCSGHMRVPLQGDFNSGRTSIACQ